MFTSRDYDRLIGRHIDDAARQMNIGGPRYPKIRSQHTPTNPFNSVFASNQIVYDGCDLGDTAAFVRWVEGNIGVSEVGDGDRYVVSHEFDGCYMARFTLGDHNYIAHINSSSKDPRKDCKGIWNNMVTSLDAGVLTVHALFRPTDALGILRRCDEHEHGTSACCGLFRKDPVDVTIAGVIAPDGVCYSVIVNHATHKALDVFNVNPIPSPFLIPMP